MFIVAMSFCIIITILGHISHESEYIRDFKGGLGSLLKALEEDEFSKKKSPFLEASRVEE